ncbi:hypothetical protein FXW78_20670 [Rhodococcus opacus]|nr:hypothetical protein [Rhodococcus opacus]
MSEPGPGGPTRDGAALHRRLLSIREEAGLPEVSAHLQCMNDLAARLEGTGEFVDSQGLSAQGTFVRYDGEGRPPVTDGPFAESKDVIAGWMVIDVDSHERALDLAGELSAAPRAGGRPIQEWLELRPFLGGCHD